MQAMQDHYRKVPVMVMIAARDVADAIELGKHAKEQGCDAVSSGSVRVCCRGTRTGCISVLQATDASPYQ